MRKLNILYETNGDVKRRRTRSRALCGQQEKLKDKGQIDMCFQLPFKGPAKSMTQSQGRMSICVVRTDVVRSTSSSVGDTYFIYVPLKWIWVRREEFRVNGGRKE